MDFYFYGLAAAICGLISISNFDDKPKKEFSQIVTISLIVSLFIYPHFADESIHVAGIFYNFVIFTLLFNVKCRDYMNLCYLYAVSIINEVMMYASLVWFNDAYFEVGAIVSRIILVAMVIKLAKKSGGYGGIVRFIDDFRRHHPGGHNHYPN